MRALAALAAVVALLFGCTPVETEPSSSVSLAEGESLTQEQENAIGTAESYLDMGGFSRSGLINQLKFEGYGKKTAEFAVKNLKPNWKDQAAQAAENYLESGDFSRQGLSDQLEFEGFTAAQIEHALSVTY